MEAFMICNISYPLIVDINFTILGYTDVTSTPSYSDSASARCIGYAFFTSKNPTPTPND